MQPGDHSYLINGRHESLITPFDRGLAYGDGVFRTLPVYAGQPHCWLRHYRHLEEDCNALGIVCPSAALLREDITKLVDEKEDAVVKIIITRGESERGYAVPPLAQPTRIVSKAALPRYPEKFFKEGVALHLCEIRLARQPRLAGIKHLNRLENVLARMEWVDPQIADGLLLDEDGMVIECCMSNLFVRYGNLLLTPDLSFCGVAGVTRERILELAGRMDFDTRICHLRLPDLLKAEELLICNSLYGAWQVRRLVDRVWPRSTLAARLRSLLREDDAPVA
ncbi:MAG: aminodeoxychorismate lyase [Methylophilaceae bacterium]|nr:aminodeoxychorismate lyase [Methylophilaceae bacterium]